MRLPKRLRLPHHSPLRSCNSASRSSARPCQESRNNSHLTSCTTNCYPLSALLLSYTRAYPSPEKPVSQSQKDLLTAHLITMPLWRTPNPAPTTSAFLVLQGLVVVLTADYLVAAAQSRPSSFSAALRGLNITKTPPPFRQVHATGSEDGLRQDSQDAQSS